MTNTIKRYYNSIFKMAIGMVFIAILNFMLGLIAIVKWGQVGAGILVVLGGFGIYQIFIGFWVLIFEQNLKGRQVRKFEESGEQFCAAEMSKLESKTNAFKKNKNLLMITFLFGLLCLFMGAFGSWSDLTTGIGAALALQTAIMLIMGLLQNYQREFYLLKLKKFSSQNIS